MADTRDPGTVDNEDPRKSISAAPSFEECLKQRAAESGEAPAAVAAPAAAAPAAAAPVAVSSGGGGDMDAAAAIAAMEASQSHIVGNIASAIPDLALKADASDIAFTIAGQSVKLDASDAPGPANIAWLSDLCIDETMSSLTVYNGPLSDVPHLISRCAITGSGELKFFLDFRPLAYGAYDQRDASGNYPGPDTLGRKAFEYSGARKDFDTKFGTEEVVAFLEEIKGSFEGAVEGPQIGNACLGELESLTRGPLALDVTMPLSATNVDTILSAREKAASYWLEWATNSGNTHKPGAAVNGQYVYDSKYKINAYGVLLDVFVALFGQAEGEQLAAADSGPIDEAYVGGGS